MKLRGEELCERRSSQFLYMIVRYSQLHHHPSRIGKSTAPVTKRSRVQIPYKPEFFSGFLFATAKVVSIITMIFFHIILHPALLIYDCHINITSKYSRLAHNLVSMDTLYKSRSLIHSDCII